MNKAFAVLALTILSTVASAQGPVTTPPQGNPTTTPPDKPTTAPPQDTKAMKNPWKDCGIGAMIFDETKWAAVISNIIWDYGLTATTTAVSTPEWCEGKPAKTARFVFETYANLEEDIVKGDGKHARAMLDMMGCERSSHVDILRSVRTEFKKSIRSAAYVEKTTLTKAENYYDLVHSTVSGDHAQSCTAL
jgi:hypothetical protein